LTSPHDSTSPLPPSDDEVKQTWVIPQELESYVDFSK